MNRIFKTYLPAALLALLCAAPLTGCDSDKELPPITYPEGGAADNIGQGTWDNPLQVWQTLAGTSIDGETYTWTTGYIVGYIDTNVAKTLNAQSATFSAPSSGKSNLLLAADPDEKDWTKCITVQLQYDSKARNDLNLADHPDNLYKEVTIKGETGTKYLGVYGIRNANNYGWGDKGVYEEPVVIGDGPFYCDFDKGTNLSYYTERGWQVLGVSGTQTCWWLRSNQGNNVMRSSASGGTENGGPYETWLITPGIDLSKCDTKTLTFRTQAAYPAADCSMEVYVLTAKNPQACTPVKLDAKIATPPASGYSAWTGSGTIDLTPYASNPKIWIGFCYKAAKGGMGDACSTYDLDNVNVGDAPTAGDEPAPEVKEIKFTKATTIESGKRYVLEYGGKVAVPIQENYSYGYLLMGDAKVEGTTLTTAEANALTFTAEGTGFSIMDSYGRYVYMDDNQSHRSFQVSKTKPSYGLVWNVTAEADGTFKILNVDRAVWIAYAASYSNFSTTSVAGDPLPALYVETK